MAKPSFSVYTVIKRDGKEDYWLNIGAAFEHSSSDGMNILLQALPIDGKLVLRKYQEKDQASSHEEPAPQREPERKPNYRDQSKGR